MAIKLVKRDFTNVSGTRGRHAYVRALSLPALTAFFSIERRFRFRPLTFRLDYEETGKKRIFWRRVT